MAQIKEQMVVVKVSSLVKDSAGDKAVDVFNSDICAALEEAISDMVGEGYVVEVIKE